MATSAPSYASPQTSGAVRRSQQLADAIHQMQSGRTADSYRTNTGTIANVLSDAVLGYARNNAESKAEDALAADRVRVSDLIRGQFPGQANPEKQRELEAQQLGSNAAFDLTPQAFDARSQQTATPSLASLLFEATGDPAAAISAGVEQQQAMKPNYQFLQGPDGAIVLGDQNTGGIRELQSGAPKSRPPIIIGSNAYDPETYEPVIQGETKPNLPDGWQMGEDGKPAPIPGYAEWYRKVHPDASGGGGQPPSGYRWNQNNELEPIPGGPAAKKNGPNGISFDQIRQEQSMADDWSRIQKDYDNVNSQYERAKALGGLATKDKASQSAADLALIVTITKMLDPTSVAREGEVKLTQSSASLWQQAQNLPNQWQYGQTTLPPEQRAALLRMADEIMPSYQKAYQNRLGSVYETANAYGFDPKRTMPGANLQPFEPKPDVTPMGGQGEWNLDAFRGINPTPQAAPAMQPGAIDVDDSTGEQYRFKGGDPTNPNSWELVR